MGIMTRKVGEQFVITSDRMVNEVPSNRAPKKRISDEYQVWTGAQWSAVTTDATTFPSMDTADEYVRAHYALVMK